jgi:alanine racemase
VHGEQLGFPRALGRAAQAAQTAVPVHLEVDTGMGRSGVTPDEAMPLARSIAGEPASGSRALHPLPTPTPDLGFSRAQLARFLRCGRRSSASGLAVPLAHAANSAALARLPGARLDLVRPGLLAYGLRPPGAPAALRVRPVMSFRSRLLQVRELPAGHPVSYGTPSSPRARCGSVVAVGYGHGLGRTCRTGARCSCAGGGSRSSARHHGHDDGRSRAVPEAVVEDEVTIFGEQAGAVLALEGGGGALGTIPTNHVLDRQAGAARLPARRGDGEVTT